MKIFRLVSFALVLTLTAVATTFTLGLMQDAPTDALRSAATPPHNALPTLASKDSSVTQHDDASQWLLQALAQSSLSDTRPPGEFSFDAHGNLIVTAASKDVLDYFLALIGEMPDDAIRTILADWVRHQQDDAAATQVLALFDRYRQWLHAFASGDYTAGNYDSVEAQFLARHSAREQILGKAWSDALYQQEDAYDAFSLQRSRILRADMSSREREQALATLEAQLPIEVAQAYQKQRALQQLSSTEQALRANGASNADIYQLRSQQFGSAAAERLSELDQQRAAWQQRYQQYQDQRQQILTASLSDADQQQQLTNLREQLFTPAEALRAQALDRLGASAP